MAYGPASNAVAHRIEDVRGPRTWKLMYSTWMYDTNVEPSLYLAAIGELLFLTIIASYVITWVNDLITGSTILKDNPIRNMVGYNNPCAFWDSPPALYFAFIMFCPMIYLAIRYAHMDNLRADLTFGSRQRMMCIVNWIYAVSQCVVMGIFVVTPRFRPESSEGKELSREEQDGMHHHMRLHSFFFLQLVPCLCMAIVLSYYEADKSGIKLTNMQKFASVVYVLTTLLETVFASYAIFTYEGSYGKEETDKYRVNPIVMQVIDYAWFLSLPVATVLMPKAPNIFIHYELDEEELKAAQQTSTESPRENYSESYSESYSAA